MRTIIFNEDKNLYLIGMNKQEYDIFVNDVKTLNDKALYDKYLLYKKSLIIGGKMELNAVLKKLIPTHTYIRKIKDKKGNITEVENGTAFKCFSKHEGEWKKYTNIGFSHDSFSCSFKCLMITLGNPEYGIIYEHKPRND